MRGRAPGRLDLLGGVADYSGALVLEQPLRVVTTVTAEPAGAFTVGPVALTGTELVDLAAAADAEVRAALVEAPKWTRYVVGVAVVLLRRGWIVPPLVRLVIDSEVPQSVGVSSSAALEVATARALLGDAVVDPLELALACQEAENRIVGAPCGVMDQVTVAVGTPGSILPILCRPASVGAPVPLPAGVEVVGWPTGAEHDVSGSPYGTARAAAFMGKRIVEVARSERWSWVSELPPDAVATLPDALRGDEFLDRWGSTDDPLSSIDPAATYPVRAATGFGVGEHARSQEALAHLQRGDAAALGPLLAASHAGYESMGLGHPAADARVAAALARPGVHGARSSGGGSGGTVVVLCDRGALDDVPDVIR